MNETNPLISVIISSYNYAQFIRKAIDSCLNQSYKNYEVWVIDGASQDNTVEILKSYGEKISWISEPDSGETEAMNKGLNFIKGDIVNFLCADNYLTKDAFQKVVDTFHSNPEVGIVFSDLLVHDSDDSFRYNMRQNNLSYYGLLNENPSMAQSAGFILKSVLNDVGNFDLKYRFGNDHELWLRVLKKYEGKYVEPPLAVYIEHHSTITNKNKLKCLWETFSINKKYGAKIFSKNNKSLLKMAIKHLLFRK